MQEVVNILREERAEDIVCIKVPICDAPDKYIVICTPHNMRHGEAMVLAIRKCFKLKTDCRVRTFFYRELKTFFLEVLYLQHTFSFRLVENF